MSLAARPTARLRRAVLTTICALSVLPFGAGAQQPRDSSGSGRDVVLEVPRLALDSMRLNVDDLRGHLSLDAGAVNMLQLTAGLDLHSTGVDLDMSGIFVESYFYTKLSNTTQIVDRVIRSLSRNPALFAQLMGTAPSDSARDSTLAPAKHPR